jgi:hypothetical protein
MKFGGLGRRRRSDEPCDQDPGATWNQSDEAAVVVVSALEDLDRRSGRPPRRQRRADAAKLLSDLLERHLRVASALSSPTSWKRWPRPSPRIRLDPVGAGAGCQP